MTEIDILNTDIGGQKVKDMSCLSFYQWLALKLNNVKTYDPGVVELTLMVKNPPIQRTMTDDAKLSIIQKLMKLNIPLT